MREKHLPVVTRSMYRRSTGALTEGTAEIDGGVTVPDPVHNALGPDGWREPSPYSCKGTNGSFLYADCFASGWSHPRYESQFHGNFRGKVSATLALQDTVWRLPARPKDSEYSRALRARAINTALHQLQNRQGHILETVAEFRQSIQGLARNAHSITSFCDAFERSIRSKNAGPMRKHFGLPKKHKALREWKRKLNATSSAASSFGSAWLTFWFGLAPVVSDMVLFMRILGDSNLFVQNLNGKGRGFRKQTLNYDTKILTGYNAGFDGGFAVRASVTRELGCYVSLTCRPNKNWLMQRAREASQLGAFDGLSTVWAITPYSWLIDFVLPVSQYLKGWEGRQGLDFRGGTITYYQAYVDPKVDVEKLGTDSNIEVGSPSVYGARTFSRSVLNNLPAPVFMPRLPADYWKATTALSLLATKLNLYFGKN